MSRTTANEREVFQLFLIKPSHYDDDGYVIQWLRSAIPSNSLAVLHGLALDCRDRLQFPPSFTSEIAVHDLRQFPWHE